MPFLLKAKVVSTGVGVRRENVADNVTTWDLKVDLSAAFGDSIGDPASYQLYYSDAGVDKLLDMDDVVWSAVQPPRPATVSLLIKHVAGACVVGVCVRGRRGSGVACEWGRV